MRGYVTSWPPMVREFWESFGWQEAVLKRPPPSAAAIDRMDMALQWLAWLDADDARIVWLRAGGRPWKECAGKSGSPVPLPPALAFRTLCRRLEA